MFTHSPSAVVFSQAMSRIRHSAASLDPDFLKDCTPYETQSGVAWSFPVTLALTTNSCFKFQLTRDVTFRFTIRQDPSDDTLCLESSMIGSENVVLLVTLVFNDKIVLSHAVSICHTKRHGDPAGFRQCLDSRWFKYPPNMADATINIEFMTPTNRKPEPCKQPDDALSASWKHALERKDTNGVARFKHNEFSAMEFHFDRTVLRAHSKAFAAIFDLRQSVNPQTTPKTSIDNATTVPKFPEADSKAVSQVSEADSKEASARLSLDDATDCEPAIPLSTLKFDFSPLVCLLALKAMYVGCRSAWGQNRVRSSDANRLWREPRGYAVWADVFRFADSYAIADVWRGALSILCECVGPSTVRIAGALLHEIPNKQLFEAMEHVMKTQTKAMLCVQLWDSEVDVDKTFIHHGIAGPGHEVWLNEIADVAKTIYSGGKRKATTSLTATASASASGSGATKLQTSDELLASAALAWDHGVSPDCIIDTFCLYTPTSSDRCVFESSAAVVPVAAPEAETSNHKKTKLA